ncbi:MAG: hypothetical protein QF371_08985, partial [Flavobacteriales bacterium]|nr:hypothetical protein [Flavobacteriales bacterium]
MRTWLGNTWITVVFGILYAVSQFSIGMLLENLGTEVVLRLQTSFSVENFIQTIELWREAETLQFYFKHFYLDFPHPI